MERTIGNFSVSAAILTYSDRGEILISVIDGLLKYKLNKIYIFCNEVPALTLEHLRDRFSEGHVIFIQSKNNLGSAGGYFELLKYISLNDESDYILLLDDDNKLQHCDSFDFIDDSDTIYYINRPSRKAVVSTIESGNAAKILGPKAGFLGRSIFPSHYEEPCIGTDLMAAPYGGMMLPKKVLTLGVFPDKDYFLYADDYAYSYSLVADYGFKIKFVESAQIVDLEDSFHLESKRNLFRNRYMSANRVQLYYSVRNQIYFILSTSTNKLLFYINLIVFYPVFLFQFLLTGNFPKARLFTSAVCDGLLMYFRSRK